jgi:hypothetical protein
MEEELLDEPEEEGFDDSGDDGGIAVPAPPPPPPPPPSTPKRTKRVRISSEAPEEVEEQPPAKDKPAKPRGKGRPPGSANKPKSSEDPSTERMTIADALQATPGPEDTALMSDWLSMRMYTHTVRARDAIAFMTTPHPAAVYSEHYLADVYAYQYLNDVRVVPCAGTQASEIFRAFLRPPVEGGEVSYMTYVPTAEMVSGLCADPTAYFISDRREGEKPVYVDVCNPAVLIPTLTYGWWQTRSFERWAEQTFGPDLFTDSRFMHRLFSDDYKGLIASLLDGVLGTTRGRHWKKVCVYLVYIRFTPIQIPERELYSIQLRQNVSALRKYDPMPETMISIIRRHPDYLKTCATWAVVSEYMALVRKNVQKGPHVPYHITQQNRLIVLDKLIEKYQDAHDVEQTLGEDDVFYSAQDVLSTTDKIKILSTVRKTLQHNVDEVIAKWEKGEEERLRNEAAKAAVAVSVVKPVKKTSAELAAEAQKAADDKARQEMAARSSATPDKPRSRFGPKIPPRPEDEGGGRMQIDDDPYYRDL